MVKWLWLPLILKQKSATQMFSVIQVTPSLFPFEPENRMTFLQDLISLNNLGIPNKWEVLCQGLCLKAGIEGKR